MLAAMCKMMQNQRDQFKELLVESDYVCACKYTDYVCL